MEQTIDIVVQDNNRISLGAKRLAHILEENGIITDILTKDEDTEESFSDKVMLHQQ